MPYGGCAPLDPLEPLLDPLDPLPDPPPLDPLDPLEPLLDPCVPPSPTFVVSPPQAVMPAAASVVVKASVAARVRRPVAPGIVFTDSIGDLQNGQIVSVART